MIQYQIRGLPVELGAAVRADMRSPQYGHPATREVATGTGPCRICLRRFEIGTEERILFTYRPDVDSASVAAPGPVFIHAEDCTQYAADTFPEDLRSLALVLEGRASGNRTPHAMRVQGENADAALAEMFAHEEVEYVFVRHGEAGCHIARIDRSPLPHEQA